MCPTKLASLFGASSLIESCLCQRQTTVNHVKLYSYQNVYSIHACIHSWMQIQVIRYAYQITHIWATYFKSYQNVHRMYAFSAYMHACIHVYAHKCHDVYLTLCYLFKGFKCFSRIFLSCTASSISLCVSIYVWFRSFMYAPPHTQNLSVKRDQTSMLAQTLQKRPS